MAAITIECADCGAKRQTKWRNTKYCKLCRTYRDLLYIGNRRSKCIECEDYFAPTRAFDRLCGSCEAGLVSSRQRPQGDCAFCKTAGIKTVAEEVAVCLPCGTDPHKRELLLKAISKKRKTRGEDL